MMVTEEGVIFIPRLQRLYELISTLAGGSSENGGARKASGNTLLYDAARTYSTILAEVAGSTLIPSCYPTLVYEALRVASLLLSVARNDADADANDDEDARGRGVVGANSGSGDAAEAAPVGVELGKPTRKWILEGVSKITHIMPHDWPLEPRLQEELIAVVHLLVYAAAQQQKQVDLEHNLPIKSLVDANPSWTQCVHTLMESHLRCAQALVERGLRFSRDAEQLLSTANGSLGGHLQAFLLRTLRDEFTAMQRFARGLSTGVDHPANGLSATTDILGNPDDCFSYYVPLNTLHNNSSGNGTSSSSSSGSSGGGAAAAAVAAIQPGQGASTSASAHSTGCTAPCLPLTGEEYTRGLHGDIQLGSLPQRVVSRAGAAIHWALSVLMSLGAVMPECGEGAVVAVQECYNNRASDLSVFIGDLVNVCVTVVCPFLLEQLHFLQNLPLDDSSFSANSRGAHRIHPYASKDAEKYRHYTCVVERFLHRWKDPSSAQPSLVSKLTETVVAERCTTPAAMAGGEEVSEGKKEEEGLWWEPVAPALAARLASGARDIGEVAWSDVVSLLTEVKRFREVEMGALWGQWAQLHKETAMLAAETRSMQRRCDALLRAKAVLLPLNGSCMEELEQKWVERVGQHVRGLEDTIAEEVRRLPRQ